MVYFSLYCERNKVTQQEFEVLGSLLTSAEIDLDRDWGNVCDLFNGITKLKNIYKRSQLVQNGNNLLGMLGLYRLKDFGRIERTIATNIVHQATLKN